MQIGVLSEPTDRRVALVPEVVEQLVQSNNKVLVASGSGKQAYISDQQYQQVGAAVTSQEEVLKSSDILISINKPPEEVYNALKNDAVVISSFQPFNDAEISKSLSKHQITVFSMDMVPRITLAQAMDVLSSMASICRLSSSIAGSYPFATVFSYADHRCRYHTTC